MKFKKPFQLKEQKPRVIIKINGKIVTNKVTK